MKLKNKKTGEIIAFDAILPVKDVAGDSVAHLEYNSLAELNAEWEDYEEPKPQVVYYIDRDGRIVPYKNIEYPKRMFDAEQNKEIGNYFETREEAEKAVEKLKAWKRLKDKGFKFAGYSHYDSSGDESPAIAFEYSDLDEMFYNKQVVADLDLLFGGEE